MLMKIINASCSGEDHIIFIFENGKGVRIPLSAYETKSNRKRLTSAYSDTAPLIAAVYETEPMDFLIVSDVGKGILIKSSLIPEKTTRTSTGVILYQLRKKQLINGVYYGQQLERFSDAAKCRKIKIPAVGSPLLVPDLGEMQIVIE